MRKIPVGLVILTFFLGFLTSCQQATVQGEEEQEQNKTGFPQLPSDDPRIHVVSKIAEYKNYQYAIHYPKIEAEIWNKEMKTWVKKKVQEFEDEVTTLSTPDQRWPYELHIDFEIFDLTDEIISVKFNESKFLGGAHTEERTFTYNFDRKDGKFIELAHLFKERSNYLKLLSDLAYEKLMDIPEMQELVWDEHFQAGIDPVENNFESFALNKGKLLIFFQRYQVGPNSIGSPMIEFTAEELQAMLKSGQLDIFEQPDAGEGKETLEQLVPEDKPALDPNKKHVALTFDDGPHNSVTPQILDLLAKHDAHATFFVLGNRVEFHPELLVRIMKEGHEIGNHSWSHPQLTNLSEAEVKAQISKTNDEIEKIIGEKAKFIRPPYGAVNEMTRQYIDFPIINWTVDPKDWKSRDSEAVFLEVKKQVFDGAIILMHDIYPSTADALANVLVWLDEEGYQVVTVSDLLETDDKHSLEAGKVYSSQSN